MSRSDHPSGRPLNNGDSRSESSVNLTQVLAACRRSSERDRRRPFRSFTFSVAAALREVLGLQSWDRCQRQPRLCPGAKIPPIVLQIFRGKSCPTATPSSKRYLSTRQKRGADANHPTLLCG